MRSCPHPAELLAAPERSDVSAARGAQVAALIELTSALADGVTFNAGLGSIVTVSARAHPPARRSSVAGVLVAGLTHPTALGGYAARDVTTRGRGPVRRAFRRYR
jgi:hypothetical protein